MRPQDDFQRQLERGSVYEAAFANWLQAERGYHILPAYEYSGLANSHAPCLALGDEKLVTPDVLAFKSGLGLWFDPKLKTRADLYRKTNTWETGTPLRNYRDYERIAALTGMDVWLVFIHEREQVVKVGKVGAMPHSHTDTTERMDRGGTIFFKFNRLAPLMTLDELNKYRW